MLVGMKLLAFLKCGDEVEGPEWNFGADSLLLLVDENIEEN
jgi:hypothetical protein